MLSVPDMMCEESCAVKVHDVLAKQEGVREVKVNFPHRTATLSVSRSQFDIDRAIAALVDHGFEEAHLVEPGDTAVVPIADSAAIVPSTPPAHEEH
jgi:copper chaperone CopZ